MWANLLNAKDGEKAGGKLSEAMRQSSELLVARILLSPNGAQQVSSACLQCVTASRAFRPVSIWLCHKMRGRAVT